MEKIYQYFFYPHGYFCCVLWIVTVVVDIKGNDEGFNAHYKKNKLQPRFILFFSIVKLSSRELYTGAWKSKRWCWLYTFYEDFHVKIELFFRVVCCCWKWMNECHFVCSLRTSNWAFSELVDWIYTCVDFICYTDRFFMSDLYAIFVLENWFWVISYWVLPLDLPERLVSSWRIVFLLFTTLFGQHDPLFKINNYNHYCLVE